MCGRFALVDDGTAVAAQFDLAETPALAPRYNIAPTQPIAAIGRNKENGRGLTHFHWGLVPSWAKDVKMASQLINARAETVAEKPSFRAAFKRRRCLVPMSGFYEWQKQADGGKQPHHIHTTTNGLLAAAGLWERWQDAEGNALLSCTILTTTPNELMQPLHNRMPVFIAPTDYDAWLAEDTAVDELQYLLRPYPTENMAAHPISTYVNSPRNEGPACLERR